MRVFEELDAESRRGGKGSHDYGKHAGNIGVDLLDGCAGLQPGETFVAEIPEVNFVAVKLEGRDQRRIVIVKEMKTLRQHADDLPALAIHKDVAADSGGVASKFAAPIAVGEHHGFGSARRIILFGKSAPEQGRNAEERKSAVSHAQRIHLFGFGNTGDAYGITSVKANVL